MSLKFMIVDDSSLTRKKLVNIIKKMEHTVVYEAVDGVDAVEKYDKYQPDVVTMDINMPNMNGIEATKNILKKYPTAKIVMVTANGFDQTIFESIEVGAKGYIIKPFNQIKIQEVIDSLYAYA